MSNKPKGQKSEHGIFFQVSLSGLKASFAFEPSPLFPATYLALCNGVDERNDLPRGCTHGLGAVIRRLSQNGFKRADYDRAIQGMVKAGLLKDLQPSDDRLATVRFQVSPNLTNDMVAIARSFVEPRDEATNDGESHYQTTTLAGMLRACKGRDAALPREQARIDLLPTYFHLLSSQDFTRHGGVDPTAIAGRYVGCDGNDHELIPPEGYIPVAKGHSTVLRYVKSDGQMEPSPKLGNDVLNGVLTVGRCQATPQERVVHAVKELERMGLLYRVAVLWDADPRRSPGAAPIATIAVRRRALPVTAEEAKQSGVPIYEPSALRGIRKLFERWRVQDVAEQFTLDGKSKWTGSPVFPYIVPYKRAKDWVLLDQYRVRWWPATNDYKEDVLSDDRRIEDYLEDMRELVEPELYESQSDDEMPT